MKRLIQNHPVVSFFALTYFISISFAILTRMMLDGVMPVARFVPSLVAFGPSIAGISLTAFIHGRSGLRDLLSHLNPARMGWRWPIVCVALPPTFLLLAVGIHAIGGGGIPTPNWSSWPNLLSGTLWTAFLGAGLQEEFGWRGFALPHLQRSNSALVSSLVVGLVWALWHFPHRLLGLGPPVDALELLTYVIPVIAMSLFFAFVFNSTNGSLVAVMLLHGANNASWKFVRNDLFPSIDMGGDVAENLLAGSIWVVAAMMITIVFGPQDLSKKPRQLALEPVGRNERPPMTSP